MEQAAAAAELRRLQAEGFFRDGDYSTDRMCAALAAGNFTRVLQLDLLRSITGAQFSDALSKSLAPRVAGTGALTLPMIICSLDAVHAVAMRMSAALLCRACISCRIASCSTC